MQREPRELSAWEACWVPARRSRSPVQRSRCFLCQCRCCQYCSCRRPSPTARWWPAAGDTSCSCARPSDLQTTTRGSSSTCRCLRGKKTCVKRMTMKLGMGWPSCCARPIAQRSRLGRAWAALSRSCVGRCCCRLDEGLTRLRNDDVCCWPAWSWSSCARPTSRRSRRGWAWRAASGGRLRSRTASGAAAASRTWAGSGAAPGELRVPWRGGPGLWIWPWYGDARTARRQASARRRGSGAAMVRRCTEKSERRRASGAAMVR
jgi:hypothetical protein